MCLNLWSKLDGSIRSGLMWRGAIPVGCMRVAQMDGGPQPHNIFV